MSSSHDITLTPQEQALIMRLKSFRVPEMAHILEVFIVKYKCRKLQT